MKSHGAILAALFLLAVLAASANAAHLEKLLNGEWDFTFRNGMIAETPPLPPTDDYVVTIRVPDYLSFFNYDRFAKARWRTWGKHDRYGIIKGIGFYRKILEVPREWQGKVVRLYVGRAYNRTNVWVNGEHLILHPWTCMAPLWLDLSRKLIPGKPNEIVISVDNVKPTGILCVHYYGGIVGPVRLEVSNGPGRIDDLTIRAGKDTKEAIWTLDLNVPFKGASAGASEIRWTVKDARGKSLGAGRERVDDFTGARTVTWTSRHSDILPWSPKRPNLYTADVAWMKGGKCVDSVQQKFGLRKWSYEGRVLKLNGKPIYLRQCEIHVLSHPTHYRYPPDKDYWLRFFALRKTHGYNAIDDYELPPTEEALQAADEIGLVVTVNGGLHRFPYNYYRPRRRPTQVPDLFEALVRSSRGHPSTAIYCLGGEEPYYDGFIEDVAKMKKILDTVNPGTLLMPNHAMRGIEYDFQAADKPHLKRTPFLHHPERLRKLTACSDIFGQFPLGAFSYNPCGPGREWRRVNRNMTVFDRPLISHEVIMSNRFGMNLGNLVYPEDLKFTSLRYGRQDMTGLCYHYGAIINEAHLRRRMKRGRESGPSRWDAYRKTSLKQSRLCKYTIEKLRKCGNIVGYQGFQIRAGMNMLLEYDPGFSRESILRYNNESVLLLDFDTGASVNRNYWEGDPFKATAMVSLYGERPIPRGYLTWTLTDGRHVLDRGFKQVNDIPNYKVSNLADIELKWPEGKQSRKVTLAMVLSGHGYQLSNEWDFWVFKKPEPLQTEAACSKPLLGYFSKLSSAIGELTPGSRQKLWVTDVLDEKGLQHLERGGTILLVGNGPFPVNRQWGLYTQGIGYYANAVHLVHDHPVLNDVPNEGWDDWQFYQLIYHVYPVAFQDYRTTKKHLRAKLPPEFARKLDVMKAAPYSPILETVPYHDVNKRVVIFELNAGKGRLVVSACEPRPDPAVMTLYHSALRYAAAPDPKRGGPNCLAVLRELVAGKAAPEQPGQEQTVSKPGGTQKGTWTNKPVTLTFPAPKWYRINNGEWKQGKKVLIAQEGRHKVDVRNSMTESQLETLHANIDTTAPVLGLETFPDLQQFGGEMFGTRDTVFWIAAQDDLSGLASMEIAVDSDEFRPYAKKPFRLPKGKHRLKARCTDRAGNVQNVFTRGNQGGGPTETISIEVK